MRSSSDPTGFSWCAWVMTALFTSNCHRAKHRKICLKVKTSTSVASRTRSIYSRHEPPDERGGWVLSEKAHAAFRCDVGAAIFPKFLPGIDRAAHPAFGFQLSLSGRSAAMDERRDAGRFHGRTLSAGLESTALSEYLVAHDPACPCGDGRVVFAGLPRGLRDDAGQKPLGGSHDCLRDDSAMDLGAGAVLRLDRVAATKRNHQQSAA